MTRPQKSDYNPHYEPYVSKVPEENVLSAMKAQHSETLMRLRAIPEDRVDYAYAPGKWTVREVLGHIIDTERIFGFRAFAFARGEQASLPGADEDSYAKHAESGRVDWKDLIEEYDATRRSTMFLFKHLPDEAWDRTGVANNNPITVRALAYAIVGHERHHLGVLKAKYGV